MNINEIDREIHSLESGQTTFTACEKLAWLYVVRDHLNHTKDSSIFDLESDTEFMSAISGKPIDKVLHVLNEHMDVIKIVYPKEYEALLKKIGEL